MEAAIRQINESEIPAYRDLRLRGLQEHPDAFGETAENFSKKSLDEIKSKLIISKKGGGFILGAFADDSIVGTVALGRESGEKLSHRGMLWGMYVLPDFRNKNIGVRLIEELLKVAKKTPGIEQIHLAVAVTNTPALRLYERIGFKIYGTDPRVLKVGSEYFDEYLMVMYL